MPVFVVARIGGVERAFRINDRMNAEASDSEIERAKDSAVRMVESGRATAARVFIASSETTAKAAAAKEALFAYVDEG